jgi:metal-responsive CopG/Arc/MetJ family transcriptional regulator
MNAIWYSADVARRQTLVQLNDELLALLDRRAARDGRSRSQLIREALEEYLRDEREAEIDRQIVEAYMRMPQPERDPWAEAAGRRTIADEPW